ncbi:MAG TPA: 50S ribosomal protein L15 [Myxococcales bacterium]|jgi:large subunit ribosomal protein L15|nr:50S ribosomal protein L15 [Myxococcales bacterium]
MKLHAMKAPHGSSERRKRVGRGQSSGLGKTAGRGGKGQKARSGNMHFEGFEGGQMPLQRRLPKFGFKNPFRKEFAPVNVVDLARFAAGTVVDPEALEKAGLLRQKLHGVKILGDGALDRALTVRAHRFSASAKEKIEKAGGKVEVI